MLNVDGSFSNFSSGKPPQEPAIALKQLKQWLQQIFGHSHAHLKVRLKGNHLHILVESDPSPEAETIVAVLSHVLASPSPDRSLPLKAAHIHRLIVYGRQMGSKAPLWTKVIDLNWNAGTLSPVASSPVRSSSDRFSIPESLSEAPIMLENEAIASHFTLAQQGQPDAIARYLSSALSHLGVAVRAKTEKKASSPVDGDTSTESASRLLILCESAYSPDLSLLRDVIAQRLRELELQQIRDAVIFGQVSGETKPEWTLRVDLTSAEEILQDWARWGDVQAIAQLLNRYLGKQSIELSALLKDATLHLSCAGIQGTVPNQATAIAVIEPILQTLAPQGIHGAAVYGVIALSAAIEAPPTWVHWLDLPASHRTELTPSTLELACHGSLDAITFLLTRLVNPDLDAKLATGGIRVQIRQKGNLLHIMTDAPNCPRQDAVAAPIARFLKPLQVSSVTGVRVYGRRAGQREPLWHYGLDFESRDRLVPAASPEFAALATHVDELLSPAGALVPWAESPIAAERNAIAHFFDRALERVQRSLIQTQFFIPLESAPLNPSPSFTETPPSEHRQRLRIGLVWSIVGILLVLQIDWLLGYWLQSSQAQSSQPQTSASAPPPISKTPTTQLPDVPLSKRASSSSAFNSSSFTQPGETILSPAESTEASDSKGLLASPEQAKANALTATLDYPSFNSRQFDRQLAVYKSYLEIFGTPDVLIVGSSRALRGIDPAALETALAKQGYANIQIFNFGINGATAQVVDLLVQHVLPQDKLPKLLIFADGARAFNSARTDITYNGMIRSQGYRTLSAGNPPIASTTIAQAPTAKAQPNGITTSVTEENSSPSSRYQQVNEQLTQQIGGLSTVYAQRDRLKLQLREQLISLLPAALSPSVLASSDSLLNSTSPAAAASSAPSLAADGEGMIDIDGFLSLPIRFNPVTYYQKYARVSGDYDSDYESFALEGVQTDALKAIANYAQAKKLPLVFVNLPLTQEYLDPTRKRHEDAFQQHLLSLAPQLGFIYRDLSSTLVNQPDYFSDPSHLNRYGAYAVSQRLAQDVMIPWQVVKDAKE
jgi:hypothetical protein